MNIIAIGTVLLNIVKAILPSASDITKVVLGNQGAAANNNAEADKAAQDAYAREFSYPLGANRTRFDAFMDGLNRLPRPLLIIGIIGMIVWPCFDDVGATKIYKALGLVPEMLWQMGMLIVSFYFTSRYLEKVSWNKTIRQSVVARVTPAADARSASQNAVPDQKSSFEPKDAFDGLGLVGVQDELLRLAGFGPGQLSSKGYSGTLPISRAAGWRNPIAMQYAVDDGQ